MIPPQDRLAGPGTSAIMAAFTHVNPQGSRFSDGTYGVYYAGKELETAIAETCHHRERFMMATAQPPMEPGYARVSRGRLPEPANIRGMRARFPEVYAAEAYSASQALGRRLREQHSWGIAYDSVRHAGGECIGIFLHDRRSKTAGRSGISATSGTARASTTSIRKVRCQVDLLRSATPKRRTKGLRRASLDALAWMVREWQ